jgi:hypothetical protein
MSTYRLYIDEIGNSGQKVAYPNNPNDRYLSLTGVIVSSDHSLTRVLPDLDGIKRRYFQRDPDIPVILHRTELLGKKPPFDSLQDPPTEKAFASEFFTALVAWDITVVSATIDKHGQKQKYTVWQYAPYHYCLEVLLERYAMHLSAKGARGDVMVESRQTKDDEKLKTSYRNLYTNGNSTTTAAEFQNRLTSGELKVRPKTANIAGLQIADLLACAACRGMLIEKNMPSLAMKAFDQDVWTILEASKFRRANDGTIWGYGKKLLP